MSLTKSDWLEEKQRVEEVIEQIDRTIEKLEEQTGTKKAEIVEDRKHFWDDMSVNLEGFDEMLETYGNIQQQSRLLASKERLFAQAQKRLKTMFRLKQSPYFGRIDFAEEGMAGVERIYIGIGALTDDNETEFLIYDWRAPVSSLYYDFPPGPARYSTPGGEIDGELREKRQYIIRDGDLQSMFDAGVTIGDELLQEVLGKQSDAQMKSIVATIQTEQNRIIRDERTRLIVVQGPAGSGKTSAALQRIAYLLYRYRGTLTADQIVLFSPNPIFNGYVSTVLPELGEENMQQTTFQEYLTYRINDEFTLEDPFDQMEYSLCAMNEEGYDARMAGVRYKASFNCLLAIDRYLEALKRNGLVFRNIDFRGESLISSDAIYAKFYSYDSSLSIPNRLKLVAEWLIKELEGIERRERAKDWVDEEIELMSQEDYDWAFQSLQRKKQFNGDTFDDFEQERELLATRVVRECFKPLFRLVKSYRFLDVPAVYRQLFEDSCWSALLAGEAGLPPEWDAIRDQTLEKLNAAELFYEDATPYLYLKERMEGFHVNRSIRHVFIDEAQDYSIFQFAFLSRLFPRSRFTLLGDSNQAIFAHTSGGNSALETVESVFGEEGEIGRHNLARTYRSTRPIVEFTRRMLADTQICIEPFNRTGDEPTVTEAADESELPRITAERVQAIQRKGHKTVGVICKTERESKSAFAALRELLPVCLIGKESSSFQTGVMIIPSYLAKGVEFDTVIIYNASQENYGRESERKLLYTACTRAMHELHIQHIGPISPFIR